MYDFLAAFYETKWNTLRNSLFSTETGHQALCLHSRGRGPVSPLIVDILGRQIERGALEAIWSFFYHCFPFLLREIRT